MFLAREIFEIEKCKLDGRPSGFGIPYRFYVGIKTEFFDSIEQNRTFDSLGEDLRSRKFPEERKDGGMGIRCGAVCHIRAISAGVTRRYKKVFKK